MRKSFLHLLHAGGVARMAALPEGNTIQIVTPENMG